MHTNKLTYRGGAVQAKEPKNSMIELIDLKKIYSSIQDLLTSSPNCRVISASDQVATLKNKS